MNAPFEGNHLPKVILRGGVVTVILQGLFLLALSTKFWHSVDLLTVAGWLAFTPGMLFTLANLGAAVCMRKGRAPYVLVCLCFCLTAYALPKAAYRQQNLRRAWFVTAGIAEYERLRVSISAEPRLLGSVRARVKLKEDPSRLIFGCTNLDGSISLEFYGIGPINEGRRGYLFHTGMISEYRYKGVRSFRSLTNNWYEFN